MIRRALVAVLIVVAIVVCLTVPVVLPSADAGKVPQRTDHFEVDGASIASKCDAHGNRVYVSWSFKYIAVAVSDPSCVR
jgi:hypothetical protein